MFAPRAGRFLAALSLLWILNVLAAAWFWAVERNVALSELGVAVAVILGPLVVFLAIFFRDPERTIGDGIVSAADGRVRSVETRDGRLRIAVFMNVHNVHVNRFPISGRVRAIETRGAGFRPAYASDAHHNLRRHYFIETTLGEVEVVQMTGIVARRLVSLVTPGESKEKGDRLGMILLGSRVDVLLPADRAAPAVAPGAVVRAGSSTIARERSA